MGRIATVLSPQSGRTTPWRFRVYGHLKHAPGAKLNGAFVQRQFTIKDDDDGWWKQHNPTNSAKTEIPENLRFKYH